MKRSSFHMMADFDDKNLRGLKHLDENRIPTPPKVFPTLQSYDGNQGSANALIEPVIEVEKSMLIAYGATGIAPPNSIRSSPNEQIVLIERKQSMFLLMA